MRRQRPRRRRADDQRDELAALHSITSSAVASSLSGICNPSALAATRLITRSNLVGCSTGMSAGCAPRSTLSTNSAARRNRSGKFGPYDIKPPGSMYSREPYIVGSRAPSAKVLMRKRLVNVSALAGTISASVCPPSPSNADTTSSARPDFADGDLETECLGRCPYLAHVEQSAGIADIDQNRDASERWQEI